MGGYLILAIYWCWGIFHYIKNKEWRIKKPKTEKLSTKDYIIVISAIVVGTMVVILCFLGIIEAYMYIKSMYC